MHHSRTRFASVPTRRRRRRGAAMMLVLVALATASIATTAYLASRDNSAAIGRAAAESAECRWSADSGIDLAMAILQTDVDWRIAHAGGLLVGDLPIGDGTLDIRIVDPATGKPPTADCNLAQIVARARVGGQEQLAIAEVRCDPWKSEVSLDLSDFALYADSRVRLEQSATLARWEQSPGATLKPRIPIGTTSASIGSIEIADDAAAIDATLVKTGSVASLSMTSTSSPDVEVQARRDALPFPKAPAPSVLPPTILVQPSLNFTFQEQTLPMNYRFENVTMITSTLHVADGVTMVVENQLWMSDASIVLEGDAQIVVFGDVTMSNGASIETTADGPLDLWIGGALAMDASYIGGPLGADAATADGRLAHQPVGDRFVRFVTDWPSGGSPWDLRNGSVIVAQVQAPSRDVVVREASAVYGRIAASRIDVTDTSAVFYDPLLDRRTGLAHLDSAAYDSTGRLRTGITGIALLDGLTAQTLSVSLGAVVRTPVATVDLALDPTVDLPPTGVTPRTRKTHVDTIAIGRPVSDWERLKGGASGGITARVVVAETP